MAFPRKKHCLCMLVGLVLVCIGFALIWLISLVFLRKNSIASVKALWPLHFCRIRTSWDSWFSFGRDSIIASVPEEIPRFFHGIHIMLANLPGFAPSTLTPVRRFSTTLC